MKIGIDATSLARTMTGVERYTGMLVRQLLEHDNENEYVVFCRNSADAVMDDCRRRAQIVLYVGNQLRCEQWWLPRVGREHNLDLMHYPAFPPGLRTVGKYVMTVHDATIWKLPRTLSWKARLYLKPLTARAITHASGIITVSDTAKDDIVRYSQTKVPVVTTYEAIDEKFSPVTDKAFLKKVRQKYRLPERIVLFVGSLEPRKNLLFLLRTFAGLDSRQRYSLVLVGRKAWGYDQVVREIKRYGLQNNVIVTGYVDDDDLSAVYTLADLFVFPTRYEGFGLPALEAMACGVPVVATRTDALNEVLADAAIFVDVDNEQAWVRSIDRILRDTQARQCLREKGLARCRFFSGEDVAARTVAAYKRFLEISG